MRYCLKKSTTSVVPTDAFWANNPIKGISHIDSIALLTLEGSGMVGVAGSSKRLFEVLSHNSINVIFITQASSEHSICIGILNADADRSNVLYDLDYCVTARYMHAHLRKFKKNFIMTFARRIKDEETFNAFFRARGEKLKSVLTLFTPIQHSILTSENGSTYYYVEYRDTSAMCCIAKIN